mmetsp:Transcript_9015/g.21994  ORF Transcript_9015/g.21994 Transcript_9015/m.21994 type:complete len:383 (+) Transcript_9015:222-1370(+)|eukprot:CAMPEP_0178997160 /NCGR_PEP_ID=MMETSP0795-20121207/8773_1 /TAXON_ID=88552 /ORGANISM="Amoebophrya sp., Strain Ameob2" /LENGTH=382 /DNA_ID=CAMNT_0020689637 /DNA_START=139 /DNA_END=1287 /DNA_ORIENTATION=-
MTSRTSAAAGEYLHGVADYLERVQIYPYFHLLVKELVAQQPADPVQFLIDFIPRNPTTARIVVLGPGCESFAKCIAADGVGVAKADEIEVCDGAALGSKDAIIASLRAKPKWVCFGYPRNAEDALDIAGARVLVSLVVVLQDSMQTEASAADHGIATAIAQYPQATVCVLDADEFDFEHNLSVVKRRLLNQSVPSQPKAPPQIIIYGARGSGATTQAEMLAKKRGLVLVDVHRLAAGSKSAQERKEAVEARLLRKDARQQGFVLCHYPANAAEGEGLNKWLKQMYPGNPKLIHLEASAWVCGRRLGAQMFRDGGSGRVIPPREANRNSAKSKPDGDAEANKAYHRYRNNCPALKYVFDEWHDVDAGASIQHVGEEIAEVLGI